MVIDFGKRVEMAVENTYFKKREEHSVIYKTAGRKEIENYKVVSGENVAASDINLLDVYRHQEEETSK